MLIIPSCLVWVQQDVNFLAFCDEDGDWSVRNNAVVRWSNANAMRKSFAHPEYFCRRKRKVCLAFHNRH
jgi:hypothetical protein